MFHMERYVRLSHIVWGNKLFSQLGNFHVIDLAFGMDLDPVSIFFNTSYLLFFLILFVIPSSMKDSDKSEVKSSSKMSC